MDPLAYNYDWQATDPCGSVIPDPLGANCVGDLDWNGPGTPPGDCCCGCKDPTADNYCVNCVGDCDGCGYPPPNPLGLGDPTSCCNYPTPILGCTDPTACNYISTANMDDGSCEYTSCLGCTDTTAANYDPSATIDNGSCTYGITGCTDTTACNYDATATVDDGSCKYKPLECKDLEKGCWVCKDPINFPSCQQITTATQLTLTLSYGLPGFTTQQDCINNTPCGRTDNNTPCGKLDNYVMINYANWQGMGPLDTVHFCEKCKYQGLNDPMCKCCKEDPCNKISFMTNVKNEFNLEIDEFCKYCKSGRGNNINNKLCKCCKRFEKTN
jgi:hypothetical protein